MLSTHRKIPLVYRSFRPYRFAKTNIEPYTVLNLLYFYINPITLLAPRRSKVRFAPFFFCKKNIRPLPYSSSFTKRCLTAISKISNILKARELMQTETLFSQASFLLSGHFSRRNNNTLHYPYYPSQEKSQALLCCAALLGLLCQDPSLQEGQTEYRCP